MPSKAQLADSSRLLCFVLNLNNTGRAAIDRWGLVPNGFGVHDLHHLPLVDRPRALVELVDRYVRRLRPALVVLGQSITAGPMQSRLIAAVRRLLRRLRVKSIVRPVGEVAATLLDPGDARRRGALPERIVEAFFPELRDRLVTGTDRHREREVYWRRAWHALGLLLCELAKRKPFVAFALSRRTVGRYHLLIAAGVPQTV